MARRSPSTILTLRVSRAVERRILTEARRRRRSKSAVLRQVIEQAFAAADGVDPAAEARRQSLLVSRRKSEREALAFIAGVADVRGWR